jgi:hypothetical protein
MDMCAAPRLAAHGAASRCLRPMSNQGRYPKPPASAYSLDRAFARIVCIIARVVWPSFRGKRPNQVSDHVRRLQDRMPPA